MVRWAFAELAVPEILGIVEAKNAGSCRVLEKAGFAPVGDDVNRAGAAVRIYRVAR